MLKGDVYFVIQEEIIETIAIEAQTKEAFIEKAVNEIKRVEKGRTYDKVYFKYHDELTGRNGLGELPHGNQNVLAGDSDKMLI